MFSKNKKHTFNNKKHFQITSFNCFILFSLYSLGLFKKIIIQVYKMIKNKVLNIKVIFKICLKILKINKNLFKFRNKFLFYKTLDNNF